MNTVNCKFHETTKKKKCKNSNFYKIYSNTCVTSYVTDLSKTN